jgi:hypothetical protein
MGVCLVLTGGVHGHKRRCTCLPHKRGWRPPRTSPHRVAASPDGEFMLVSWLKQPFSTAVPAGRFPVELQVCVCVCL